MKCLGTLFHEETVLPSVRKFPFPEPTPNSTCGNSPRLIEIILGWAVEAKIGEPAKMIQAARDFGAGNPTRNRLGAREAL